MKKTTNVTWTNKSNRGWQSATLLLIYFDQIRKVVDFHCIILKVQFFLCFNTKLGILVIEKQRADRKVV